MAGKRLQLARLMMATGVGGLVSGRAPARLLVLNYHRLYGPGQRASTAFDSGVFGPDQETFRRQMQWLKAATSVLDEQGLMELASNGRRPRGSIFSVVTFDDGYIDCYTLAKPVLDDLGIRGIFFLPVEMLESRQLGWWDIAAYLLKRTVRRSITVNGCTYDLEREFEGSLRRILNAFKLQKAEETEGLLGALSEACRVAMPTLDEQSAEVMNWAQAREMKTAGHAIGSHTLSHRVLATLDRGAQAREIVNSRREIEAILGCSVHSFAYPVGGPQHIDLHSVALAREAGYEQAFTFNTGIASIPVADRYLIPREAANTVPALKGKAMLPGVMGVSVRRPRVEVVVRA